MTFSSNLHYSIKSSIAKYKSYIFFLYKDVTCLLNHRSSQMAKPNLSGLAKSNLVGYFHKKILVYCTVCIALPKEYEAYLILLIIHPVYLANHPHLVFIT